MSYCIECGEKLPEGVEFCPKCGAKVSSQIKQGKKEYVGVGGPLTLIGGVLSIIFSILSLSFLIAWRAVGRWMGMHGMWNRGVMGGWMSIMAVPIIWLIVGALLSIILGAIAVYAYMKVNRGEVRDGGLIALIAGILMILTGGFIPGVITLIGGILCYTSK